MLIYVYDVKYDVSMKSIGQFDENVGDCNWKTLYSVKPVALL